MGPRTEEAPERTGESSGTERQPFGVVRTNEMASGDPLGTTGAARAISLWRIAVPRPRRSRAPILLWFFASLLVPLTAAVYATYVMGRRASVSAVIADRARRLDGASGDGCPLGGKILDEEGGAAAGATVVLFRSDGEGRREVGRQIAGAKGDFCFTDASVGNLKIAAFDPAKGEVQSAEITRMPAASAERPIVLVLVPWTELDGTVVDEAGDPIESAMLRLERAGAEDEGPAIAPPRVTTTDAQGRFALMSVGAAAYRLTAWARGYEPRAISIVAGPNARRARIALSRYAAPRAIVVDPQGRAVGGATVAICSGRDRTTLTSAQDGRIELAPHEVGCSAVAYHPRFARSLPVPLRGGHTIELRLRAGGVIEGLAGDESGRALDRLTLQVVAYRPARGEVPFEPQSWGEPTPIGRMFRLRDLAPGTYTLRFVHEVVDDDSSGTEETDVEAIEVRAGSVTRGLHVVVAAPAHIDGEPAGEGESEQGSEGESESAAEAPASSEREDAEPEEAAQTSAEGDTDTSAEGSAGPEEPAPGGADTEP